MSPPTEKRAGTKTNLSKDMISLPHGNVMHTLHVGVSGDTFGDLSHLGGTMLASIKDCRNDSMSSKSLRDSLAANPSICSSEKRSPILLKETDLFIDFGPSFYEEVMRALEDRLSARKIKFERQSSSSGDSLTESNPSFSRPQQQERRSLASNSQLDDEDDDFSEESEEFNREKLVASAAAAAKSADGKKKKKISLTSKWLRSSKTSTMFLAQQSPSFPPSSISSPVRLLKDTRVVKTPSVDLRKSPGFPPLPDLNSLGAKLTSAEGSIDNCDKKTS